MQKCKPDHMCKVKALIKLFNASPSNTLDLVQFSVLYIFRLLSHSHGHTSIPSVLALPCKTVTLDLPALQLENPCESVRGLHQLIKDKFADAVQKWFRQVPSCPDYYFYCPETLMVSFSIIL